MTLEWPTKAAKKHGKAQGVWQWKGADYRGLRAFNKASGNDVHSLFADPLFVDAANGNFHLRANSPAVGKDVQFPTL